MIFADELTAAHPVSPWRLIDTDEPLVEIVGALAGAHLMFEELADDGTARPLREIHDLRSSIYVRRPRPVRFRVVNAGPQSRVIVAGVAAIFPAIKRIRTSMSADLADIDEDADEELLEVA